MKFPFAPGPWILLPLLLAACVTDPGPSTLHEFADRDRFITRLPAAFYVVAAQQQVEPALRRWLAMLPGDKQALPLELTAQERSELRTATRNPRPPGGRPTRNVSGEAELLLMIDPEGNVIDLCLLNPVKAPADISAAALVACRDWKFTPLPPTGPPGVAVLFQRMKISFRSDRDY